MTTRRTLVTLAALAAGWGAAPTLWAQAPTPALSGVTSRGERVSLQSLQGSVVLVFVWSTRCPVCLDKLPELRRNLDGWQGKPFVILALNQDRSIDEMRGYERLLEQTGPPRSQMKHLWRRATEHRDSFGELPDNMPTTLIFDKQGALSKQLRGRLPAELWDDIAELVLG
jgi:cytochrome oxidase Cu insertion factor (SCO1/SenC/PrrC family)